jgi:hypothetical protein
MMNPLDPARNPQKLAQFDCGKVEVSSEVAAAVPETEIVHALKRHLNMDFGDQSAERNFENFCAISFCRGKARSEYTSETGQRFVIETDFDQNLTRVTLLNDRPSTS